MRLLTILFLYTIPASKKGSKSRMTRLAEKKKSDLLKFQDPNMSGFWVSKPPRRVTKGQTGPDIYASSTSKKNITQII